jgi:adenylate kinase family enzyme
MAERLGLPLVHLDRMYWRPGWVATPKGEWRATVEAALAAESWVMDGNYSGTMDLRIRAADTIVFLDLPRLLCLWRIVRRQVQFRNRERPDMTPGCPERLTGQFVAWVWNYPRRQRVEVLRRLEAVAAEKTIVILGSQRAVEQFIGDLPGSG